MLIHPAHTQGDNNLKPIFVKKNWISAVLDANLAEEQIAEDQVDNNVVTTTMEDDSGFVDK